MEYLMLLLLTFLLLDCKEFQQFAKAWEFECSPSDPYHSQTNGKAESALKIAKKLIKKTEQDGNDLWKAILDWRNTPTTDLDRIKLAFR